jgi:hypothetical protein
MLAEAKQRAQLECKTPTGKVLAVLEIIVPRKTAALFAASLDANLGTDSSTNPAETAPLVLLPKHVAAEYGEEALQLRERGRYEYQLKPVAGAPDNLMLRADRWVQPSGVESASEDRGLIEPQDHCGLLQLVVVRRNDSNETPLATTYVEVRSQKLGYREHYRGMLTYIADKCAALLLDSRAPTRLKLDTQWDIDGHFLEQQLEFLRYTLESTTFRSAIDEVLRNPHRRLENEPEQRNMNKPMKPGKDFARQVGIASQRIAVPPSHPLHKTVPSLPTRISVPVRTDFLDTPENRFAKMVIVEFRDFLNAIALQLGKKKPAAITTNRLLAEVNRLRGMLEVQLTRGFFPDVASPVMLPLGSPVLQGKAGYRELFRFWLQFHAGAQLAWHGGMDIFHAGARNVATLYEYWLFFQLEALFRQRFECEKPLHVLVLDKKKVPPQLILQRGIELATPVAGVWAKHSGRKLKAEFHFNQKFKARSARDVGGSWTRGVQPDYTISMWPADYSKEEAEANELMVHVHFDAKYRVEQLSEVIGDAGDDAAFLAAGKAADSDGNRVGDRVGDRAGNGVGDRVGSGAAKYADLLKMHAYRDAVRRTAGAYVLYPGDSTHENRFETFHEVLPGLGAFAIRPDQQGNPIGMPALAKFLDEIIEHIANRTTSRERVSYHVSQTYEAKQDTVPYGAFDLAEKDQYTDAFRAPPPAEEMVLVAWYKTAAQLALARSIEGLVYVRLGKRRGALHIPPNLAAVRKVLLRTTGTIAPGLLVLRTPGLDVITRAQLREKLAAHPAGKGVADWQAGSTPEDDHIYALFQTKIDDGYQSQIAMQWEADVLNQQIYEFENQSGEIAAIPEDHPRVIPLRAVLQARKW